MLSFLFPRLTPAAHKGAALFDAVTTKAREPHWYVEGRVPDTLEGRFRLLASVAALALVRLEREGEAGGMLSVALTERFIEVMESEHCELGLGDPTLGRTVRKLVRSLARRVELWRSATAGERDWNAAARESVYAADAEPDALAYTATALRESWMTLQTMDGDALAEGKMG